MWCYITSFDNFRRLKYLKLTFATIKVFKIELIQKYIGRLLCEYQSEGYSYPHLCVAGTDTLQGATTLRATAFRIMPLGIIRVENDTKH